MTVAVRDESDNPVAGATVLGDWAGDYEGAGNCTTADDGTCLVESGTVRTNAAKMKFVVAKVEHPQLPYVSAANWDPDGDSDGTTIEVSLTVADEPNTDDATVKKTPPGQTKVTSAGDLAPTNLYIPMVSNQ